MVRRQRAGGRQLQSYGETLKELVNESPAVLRDTNSEPCWEMYRSRSGGDYLEEALHERAESGKRVLGRPDVRLGFVLRIPTREPFFHALASAHLLTS